MKASELAEKYGVTAQKIGILRKLLCNDEDFCTKSREITPEGVKKIDEHFNLEDDKILEPQFVRVQLIGSCPNPYFVQCKLLEGKNKHKVTVAIPSTHMGSFRDGQIFKAQVIEKENEKFYRHEVLYKREEQRLQKVRLKAL
jgi:hypothetical protein